MKKTYSQPKIEKIKIDNEISMVMMSTEFGGDNIGGPPGNDGGDVKFSFNPLKWLR
jgi:hypothetical protein